MDFHTVDYLKKEYLNYLRGRRKNKTFEAIHIMKAYAIRTWLNQFHKYLKQKSEILEVGFGSGYLLSLLAKRGHEVYGIDVEPYTLRYAKKVFQEKKVKGKLSIGDGFKIPYPDNYFDLVFNLGVIEHFSFKKQDLFVKEMVRVSKKFILISVPNDYLGSLSHKFKKSKYYIPEKRNICDLKYLSKKFSLKILKNGGFHILADSEVCDKELRFFYKKNKLDLPKKKYYKKDLKELLKIEKKFSDKTLREIGAFKYILAKKIK